MLPPPPPPTAVSELKTEFPPFDPAEDVLEEPAPPVPTVTETLDPPVTANAVSWM